MFGSSIAGKKIWMVRVVFVAVATLFSIPAQTDPHLPNTETRKMNTQVDLHNVVHADHQRVAADICLNDGELSTALGELGFDDILLGDNIGKMNMQAQVRFGADQYVVVIDRCNGRLQDVVAGEPVMIMS